MFARGGSLMVVATGVRYFRLSAALLARGATSRGFRSSRTTPTARWMGRGGTGDDNNDDDDDGVKQVDRSETASRKWTRFGPEVVPLWVADMDFACPRAIRGAIADRAAHPIYGYTDAEASLERAVCEGFSRAWGGKRCDAAWLRWHPGLIPGLYHAARLAGPRGVVVVPRPVYPPFLNSAADSSHLVHFDLDSAEALNLPKLEAALDAARAVAHEEEEEEGETVVLLWCSPHNPTGRVWRRAELEAVARACRDRGVVLLSDEVWSGLVFDDAATPFVSMGAVASEDQPLIVLTSPSKTYNVAALDVAVAVIPNDALRRRYVKAGRDQAEVTPFGYAAAKAVFLPSDDPPAPPPSPAVQGGGGEIRHDVLTPAGGACEPWRLALVDVLRANRDLAVTTLAPLAPRLKVVAVPEASYLLWLDACDLGAPLPPALYLEKCGVGLTDGRPFGARGFVRLNFGCHRDTLQEGLNRIVKAVNALDDGGGGGGGDGGGDGELSWS